MDQSGLETWLTSKVRTLSSVLSAADYTEAVDSAEEELGWTLPETLPSKLKWLKERAVRHLLFSLMIENAHKFKFEQINLNQRFEHYESVIKRMDSVFEKAKKENAALFAGVSAYKLFGTKIDAGFSSDSLGRDTTYQESQIVLHHPDENGQ